MISEFVCYLVLLGLHSIGWQICGIDLSLDFIKAYVVVLNAIEEIGFTCKFFPFVATI